MPNTMQNLITVREASALTGLVPSTISRWIKANKVNAVKAYDGERAPYLIDRESFETFLSKRSAA